MTPTPAASETPRTDEIEFRAVFTKGRTDYALLRTQMAEHARTLERELSRLREETVEECALECEKPEPECCGQVIGATFDHPPECCGKWEPRFKTADECAASIRALKSKAAAHAEWSTD